MTMNHDVYMAGFGGQGILLIGNLLAYACILEGNNASYFPAYGVEKRGGAATCTVVMADGAVGSPVVGQPEAALLLNELSMEKYYDRVRPGGAAFLNSSLISDPRRRAEITTVALPANEMALQLGNARLVNMVMLGAYIAHSPVVSWQALHEALTYVLPERNHRFLPLNHQALQAGADACRQALGA
ncbi:MAG: 2-oxoacid:acceptor oxidoreductase family protein [Desulfuromonas thiophila]|uniref:2-oxoglutarate ferredoxin oxidoreductase, gamma subunit n=2 Tax=Desulfuromonas thiophila TaxID=57664 RepID=A0A1G7C1N3_9BACT|nr:2-oxoacid:acceptor oxidoreductase family protein [Desulfuromonas thiophila]MDY0398581.1 2-oxoacid:acceptor oxidoreductase family protein [Desulfuromonas thiophila]SDE33274.1 2-oxoglutarate ferredoxin oxidoreductase, gamma subunit [Desulfuromonas thiophila]